MDYSGNLLKMSSQKSSQVDYFLNLGGVEIAMNDLIGHPIRLDYEGVIHCIACGTSTKTSFFQGFCFSCFSTLPETDTCVMQPETCRAHEGISRSMEWSESHCLTPHIVYLALTSTTKVGVTRESQVPTRWIDQGAWKVIRLARTPNRFLAGRLEVELKQFFTDKTSWQKMLKDEKDPSIDLLKEKDKAWELLSEELQYYCIDEDEITEITYPVHSYPNKIKSTTFDKVSTLQGKLTGIRGQYLMFDDGQVFNVRRHSGYQVRLRN